MRKWIQVCGLMMALTLSCAAQGQAAFDVATVKPAAPLDMAKMAAAMQAGEAPKVGPHVAGGRAQYTYMTLRELIALAYNSKPYQVSGPEWMATTRFDIDAKMPEGTAKGDAPAMLQSLLKERFKLVAHPSTDEQPVLALVVAKSGSKLKAATEIPVPIDESAPLKPGEMNMDSLEGPVRVKVNADGSSTMNMGMKGTFTQKMDMSTKTLKIESGAMTMTGFADMLTQVSQMGGSSSKQVVDMTGLKGYYAINLDISLQEIMTMLKSTGMNMPMGAGGAAGDASDSDSGQTVLESLQALGLKVESRKASVQRLIIDSVSKTPTEN